MSVGRPLAGTQVHLAPAPGHPELTQLHVSSATVMKRRIGLTEGKPAEILGPDQCIPTGDIFEIDSEGYLFYKARISDFIVREADKVCLAAIRRVASHLPGVIRARTVVSKTNEGEDFELHLETTGEEHDYARLLRKWLRQSEMPHAVRLQAAELQGAYK